MACGLPHMGRGPNCSVSREKPIPCAMAADNGTVCDILMLNFFLSTIKNKYITGGIIVIPPEKSYNPGSDCAM